jgi:hypothetical protein
MPIAPGCLSKKNFEKFFLAEIKNFNLILVRLDM